MSSSFDGLTEEFGGYYVGDKPQPSGDKFDAALRSIERELGDKLPPEYAAFVRAVGGHGFDANPTFRIKQRPVPAHEDAEDPPWTQEEDRILRDGWFTLEGEELAAQLPERYDDEIMNRAHELGLTGKSDVVNVVLGFTSDAYEPVRTLQRIAERVPGGYLPVVSDPYGNYLLLKIADGSLWFWDHEVAPDPPDESCLLPVANSLTEFVKSWEASSEDDEDN